MDPYNQSSPGSGKEGSGPFAWIKKKIEGLKSRNPECVSFVAGCAAGVVLIAGTALIRNAACQDDGPCLSISAFGKKKKKSQRKVKIAVQEGETLGDIMVKYVGDYTEENINDLKKLNKTLKNIDLLTVGQELVVPDYREIEEPPIESTIAPVVDIKKQKKQQKQKAFEKKPKIDKKIEKKVDKNDKRKRKKEDDLKKNTTQPTKSSAVKESKGWWGRDKKKEKIQDKMDTTTKNVKSSTKSAKTKSKDEKKKVKLPQDKW